jgi:hypothetical protein
MTRDLPASNDPNEGFEALTWVPDQFLTSRGFIDQSTNALYDPKVYVNHGNGLFFAGYECMYN